MGARQSVGQAEGWLGGVTSSSQTIRSTVATPNAVHSPQYSRMLELLHLPATDLCSQGMSPRTAFILLPFKKASGPECVMIPLPWFLFPAQINTNAADSEKHRGTLTKQWTPCGRQ